MGNDKKWFKGKLRKLKNPEKIKVGDGAYVDAFYEGTVELEVRISENATVIYKMENALYAPDLAYNLLSVSTASKLNRTVEFKGKQCRIISNEGKVLAMAHEVGNLWVVDCEEKVRNEVVCTAVEPSKNKLWHSRFGHLGSKNLKKLVEDDLVEGLDYKHCNENE